MVSKLKVLAGSLSCCGVGTPTVLRPGPPKASCPRWEIIPGCAQPPPWRRELRREPQGRVCVFRRRGTRNSQPSLGPRADAEMSPHARSRGSEKVAARTSRAGGMPGLELRRSQEQEKAEREKSLPGAKPASGEERRQLATNTGSLGEKVVRTEVRTFSPVSPPPDQGSRQLHSRFWKGREVSDCTPPTGVRWAAGDGCSEVGVKSSAFSPRPAPHPRLFLFLKRKDR